MNYYKIVEEKDFTSYILIKVSKNNETMTKYNYVVENNKIVNANVSKEKYSEEFIQRINLKKCYDDYIVKSICGNVNIFINSDNKYRKNNDKEHYNVLSTYEFYSVLDDRFKPDDYVIYPAHIKEKATGDIHFHYVSFENSKLVKIYNMRNHHCIQDEMSYCKIDDYVVEKIKFYEPEYVVPISEHYFKDLNNSENNEYLEHYAKEEEFVKDNYPNIIIDYDNVNMFSPETKNNQYTGKFIVGVGKLALCNFVHLYPTNEKNLYSIEQQSKFFRCDKKILLNVKQYFHQNWGLYKDRIISESKV